MINEFTTCLRISDDSIGFIESKTKGKENKIVEFDSPEKLANEFANFYRFNIIYIKFLIELSKELVNMLESISSPEDFDEMAEKYADNMIEFSTLAIEFLRYGVAIRGFDTNFENHKKELFKYNDEKCYAIDTLVIVLADNEIIQMALGDDYEEYNEIAKRYTGDKDSVSREDKVKMSALYIRANAKIANTVLTNYKKYEGVKINKKVDYYG